jgi:hypothetical protein
LYQSVLEGSGVGSKWAHLMEACVGLRGSVLATWARRTMPTKAQLASPRGNPRATLSRRRRENLPPTPPPWAATLGLEEWPSWLPSLLYKGGLGHSPSPSNPRRRPIAVPPLLSLATARRRSPAAEILHHKHHAVVLLI